MSGFISNVIGSGASLILLAIALLIKKHRHHLQRLGRKTSEWSLAVALVLMVLAGSLMAFAGAGTWIIDALNWVRGELGPIGPVVFAIAALALLIKVVVAIKDKDESAMGAAFMAPIVFGLFSVGLFAHVNAVLQPLALHLAGQIQNFLGV